jgi:hypothetical protein
MEGCGIDTSEATDAVDTVGEVLPLVSYRW